MVKSTVGAPHRTVVAVFSQYEVFRHAFFAHYRFLDGQVIDCCAIGHSLEYFFGSVAAGASSAAVGISDTSLVLGTVHDVEERRTALHAQIRRLDARSTLIRALKTGIIGEVIAPVLSTFETDQVLFSIHLALSAALGAVLTDRAPTGVSVGVVLTGPTRLAHAFLVHREVHGTVSTGDKFCQGLRVHVFIFLG